MMNIHQLSVTYIQEQDRCLVRINSHDGDELRLWFTRRLTVALMPYLRHTASEQLKLLHAPVSTVPAASADTERQQMLERFKQEAEAYNGDFKTPFNPQAAQLPLGPEPVLVTEIKLGLAPGGKVDLQLIETLAEQSRNIQLAMNPQLVQGLLQLLSDAVNKSQWMEVPPRVAELSRPSDNESVSQLEPADRPKYLN